MTTPHTPPHTPPPVPACPLNDFHLIELIPVCEQYVHKPLFNSMAGLPNRPELSLPEEILDLIGADDYISLLKAFDRWIRCAMVRTSQDPTYARDTDKLFCAKLLCFVADLSTVNLLNLIDYASVPLLDETAYEFDTRCTVHLFLVKFMQYRINEVIKFCTAE